MLDIKWIRENQEAFVEGLESRKAGPKARQLLTQILSLDEQRRGTIQKLQGLQARRNAASKEVGQAKAAKDEASAVRLMDEVAAIKGAIQLDELTAGRLDSELFELLSRLPNLPLDDVPIGPDETANAVLREMGTPPKFEFQPKQHFELGEALGLMDFETAAKLSGSRFVVLKGALARLERALAQFMLDLHTQRYTNEEGKELGGYTEVNPPLLVRDDAMFGTAQLPKFASDHVADLVVRLSDPMRPSSSLAPTRVKSWWNFEESERKSFNAIGKAKSSYMSLSLPMGLLMELGRS